MEKADVDFCFGLGLEDRQLGQIGKDGPECEKYERKPLLIRNMYVPMLTLDFV